MTTPTDALLMLRAAADDGRLESLCVRLGVSMLGAFGSAVRPRATASRPPDDLDLVVSLDRLESRLDVVDAVMALTGCDAIDLVVLQTASPLLRARAMCGIGLYEREAGRYAMTQMAALAEERDTRHLRDLDLGALAS
jgi:predicted nucleotidyltransferase